MLQEPLQPISYATWCALFEEKTDQPNPEITNVPNVRQSIGVVVIGEEDQQATRESIASIDCQSILPARCLTCKNAPAELRFALSRMLDERAVTHVAVIVAGDRISVDAIAHLLRCSNETEADVIYGDHDLMDCAGRRHAPCFKPSWNEPLALTGDLLAGVTVVRKELLTGIFGERHPRAIAAWRAAVLNAASRPGVRIAHLPWILCHRPKRGIHNLTIEEQCAMIRRHDAARNISSAVEVAEGRIIRRLFPVRAPRISVIIPSACRPGVADRFVSRVLSVTDYDDLEIIVAVHRSRFEEPHAAAFIERLKLDPRVLLVIHDVAPFNYATVNNLVVRSAHGDAFCFLNDDVEPLRPDWLRLMVGQLSDPNVGAVGARLLYQDRSVQHMGIVIGMMGTTEHWQRFAAYEDPGYQYRCNATQDVSAATGACLLVRRSAYVAACGMDEMFSISYNDVDLCLRLRQAGWRIVVCGEAELIHDETASFGSAGTPERERVVTWEAYRFRERWPSAVQNDPHFNPNLSLEVAHGWRLAVPPRARRARVTVTALSKQ